MTVPGYVRYTRVGAQIGLPITLLNQSRFAVPQLPLRRTAAVVMKAEGCAPDAELNIVLGDDVWIKELNQTYKGKNRPTDVLAFPQDIVPLGEPPILGDIAISVETAARQAQELGHSMLEELQILVAHGILHLVGWRDDTPARRRRMMTRTQEILATLPPPEAC